MSRHSPGDYRDNPQVGAAQRQAELARKEAALCPGGAETVGSQRRRVDYQDIYFRQELDQIDEVIRDTRRIRCL
ncbi:hypothetical protein E0K89_002235 [Aquicoccus sp. SCR17]|nr:hypothetical protein [Carideicomes alvinocaridis]